MAVKLAIDTLNATGILLRKTGDNLVRIGEKLAKSQQNKTMETVPDQSQAGISFITLFYVILGLFGLFVLAAVWLSAQRRPLRREYSNEYDIPEYNRIYLRWAQKVLDDGTLEEVSTCGKKDEEQKKTTLEVIPEEEGEETEFDPFEKPS